MARYSVSRQREDGSWPYSESPAQRWIDNFHTGYNLCALRTIAENAGTQEFLEATRRGFEFFRQNFFGPNGIPKYFHNRAYPADIHSAAVSIITLVRFKELGAGNLELAHAVCRWALRNLSSEKGFFYYQKRPHYTNKVSYMRWGQAWMLLALSALVSEGAQNVRENQRAKHARD